MIYLTWRLYQGCKWLIERQYGWGIREHRQRRSHKYLQK